MREGIIVNAREVSFPAKPAVSAEGKEFISRSVPRTLCSDWVRVQIKTSLVLTIPVKHADVYTPMHARTHIQTRTHTHTHTHIYIHTYTSIFAITCIEWDNQMMCAPINGVEFKTLNPIKQMQSLESLFKQLSSMGLRTQ